MSESDFNIPGWSEKMIQWDYSDRLYSVHERGIACALLELAEQRLRELTERREWLKRWVDYIDSRKPSETKEQP